MIALQLLPVVFSLIVLGAHFLRAGHTVLVGLVCIALLLLGVRGQLAARVIQAVLVLGSMEWLRTLVSLAAWRIETGQPVVRLTLILGSVAIFTGLSALVFRAARIRNWYSSPPKAS